MILTILLIILFLTLYLSLEWLKRYFHLNNVLTRKIAHSTSAILAVILSVFIPQNIFLTTTSLLFIFFILSYRHNWLTSIHLPQPKTYGEILFPITIILLTLFFYNNHFILWSALLTLGISDTLTGLYNFYKKQFSSYQGSLLFFISTFLILLCLIIFLPISPQINSLLILKIASISFITTITERYSPLGFDNLTAPLLLAVLLQLIF